MNNVLAAFIVGALTLGLNGVVFAADQQQGQPQEQEKEYVAALKKCDALAGAQKQQCVDDVNRKFGRM